MKNLIHLLTDSLSDDKLQTDEKNEIEQAIVEAKLDQESLNQLRNSAFKLAKEQLNSDNAYAIIKWLERLTKTIDKTRPKTEEVNAYFSPGTDCLTQIKMQIGKARSTLDICVFTITDNRITSSLLDAHKRGIKLRIITDNDKALDKGSDVQTFLDAGIPLRLDRTENHMHHKFAIIDGTTLINGSFNWTRSATDKNQENIVVNQNVELIKDFQEHFEQLWDKFK